MVMTWVTVILMLLRGRLVVDSENRRNPRCFRLKKGSPVQARVQENQDPEVQLLDEEE